MERVVKEKTFGLGSGKGRKYGSIPYLSYLLLSKFNLLRRKGRKLPESLFILVSFKSDENSILQPAIHLFANQPIYYLLFD